MDGTGLGPCWTAWTARGSPRTRLLVSVAAAAEIEPALAGGAQILDVKDPTLGSLGLADAALAGAARAAAPSGIPVSAALGDVLPRDPAGTAALAKRAAALANAGAELLKVGLAGAPGTERARRGLLELRTRLDAAAPAPAPGLVAVAFADDRGRGAVRPRDLIVLAARAGLAGVMLDTLGKGPSILKLMGEERLSTWVAEARGAGLLAGLAGSLSLAELGRGAALDPHVLGVRGAVCRGGRAGRLSQDLVQDAIRALGAASNRPVSAGGARVACN